MAHFEAWSWVWLSRGVEFEVGSGKNVPETKAGPRGSGASQGLGGRFDCILGVLACH